MQREEQKQCEAQPSTAPTSPITFDQETLRKMGVVGACRFVSLIPSQPFYNLAINLQANPTTPPIDIIKDLSKRGVARGWYASMTPSATRMLIKDGYRFPIITLLPQALPKEMQTDQPTLYNLLKTTAISMADVGVATPLNRVSVIQSTTGKPTLQILRELPAKEYYRGAGALALQTFYGWGALVGVNYEILKHYQAKTGKTELTPKELMASGAITGVITTALGAPFSMLTTVMQREKDPVTFRNFMNTFWPLLKQSPKTAFRGAAPNMLVNSFTTAITTALMNYTTPPPYKGQSR